MRRHSYRYQRTLARSAEVCGTGLLTGANVHLQFLPAAPSSGVTFVRTDLRPNRRIRAHVDQVTGTKRRTTLGEPPGQVALVEHVLAALAGLRIDNCVVELDAVEPPGLDGSARKFVQSLLGAGVVIQPARRVAWCVDESVVVSNGEATLAIHPCDADELRISYALDYGLRSPIDRQLCTARITPVDFARDVAGCRTFILESEAAELRQQGLGSRTTASDLLVFGSGGPIDNRLRYANEPARHKILDMVGDLSLLGHDLRGHVVAYRSGHPLNVEMVRTLSRQLTEGCCGKFRRAA